MKIIALQAMVSVMSAFILAFVHEVTKSSGTTTAGRALSMKFVGF